MKEFKELVNIVERLRSEDGCPWDRKQRLANLKSYLLEESYELLDALDRRNKEKVKEELGDVFLILVFISQIFKEKGFFDLKDVLKGINEKLKDRHPHVFSHKSFRNSREVVDHWYNLKFRHRRTPFAHIPLKLPSLMKAYKIIKEAKRRGVLKKELPPPAHLRKKFSSFAKNPTQANFAGLLFAMLEVIQNKFEPEASFLRYLRKKFGI